MRGFTLALLALTIAAPASAQSWRFESDRDQFTDERRSRAVFQSRAISAGVRCHGGTLDVLFLVTYIGEEDANVRYRFDRGEVQSSVWNASTSRDGLFAWDPGDIARQMMAGATMAFEHDDFAGSPHQYTISLAGSGASIGRVLDACDVPRTNPRSRDGSIWVRVIDDLDKAPRDIIPALQTALVGLGYEVPEDGRRSQATYRALSDFYVRYREDCEGGREGGNSCTAWKSSRRYTGDADFPTRPIDLLVEVLKETAARVSESDERPVAANLGPPRPSVITNVQWSRPPRPTADDFPQRAMDRGVSGSATIQCTATASGRPANCRVVSETPSGMGFGAAGLRVVQRGVLSPNTVDQAADGSTFTVAVPFSDPGN